MRGNTINFKWFYADYGGEKISYEAKFLRFADVESEHGVLRRADDGRLSLNKLSKLNRRADLQVQRPVCPTLVDGDFHQTVGVAVPESLCGRPQLIKALKPPLITKAEPR